MDPILEKRVKDLIGRFELLDTSWVFKNNSIDSLTQNGPQCGIVALCMALKYLKVDCSVESLMNDAKNLKFTKSGELFEIDFLYQLAKKYFTGECKIHQIESEEQENELFKSILEGKMVLIAYDCDLNFEPCCKKGLKAHWTLITGFLLPVESNQLDNLSGIKKDLLFNLNNQQINKNNIDLFANYYITGFRDKIFTFCRHGKSKHYGVWNFKSLIESNKQLKEIDHLKCNDTDFIKPSDGNLQRTLAAKYLVLF